MYSKVKNLVVEKKLEVWKKQIQILKVIGEQPAVGHV